MTLLQYSLRDREISGSIFTTNKLETILIYVDVHVSIDVIYVDVFSTFVVYITYTNKYPNTLFIVEI